MVLCHLFYKVVSKSVYPTVPDVKNRHFVLPAHNPGNGRSHAFRMRVHFHMLKQVSLYRLFNQLLNIIFIAMFSVVANAFKAKKLATSPLLSPPIPSHTTVKKLVSASVLKSPSSIRTSLITNPSSFESLTIPSSVIP